MDGREVIVRYPATPISSVIPALLCLAALFASPADARPQRSAAEVLAFKRASPCPSTGLRSGACPGYQVDHADPLCAGGSDHRDNMQWLTVEEHRMKTRSDVRMCRNFRKIER